MLRIHQYSTEDGSGEYVILTEDENFDVEENRKPDYSYDGYVEASYTEEHPAQSHMALPLDYVLDMDLIINKALAKLNEILEFKNYSLDKFQIEYREHLNQKYLK